MCLNPVRIWKYYTFSIWNFLMETCWSEEGQLNHFNKRFWPRQAQAFPHWDQNTTFWNKEVHLECVRKKLWTVQWVAIPTRPTQPHMDAPPSVTQRGHARWPCGQEVGLAGSTFSSLCDSAQLANPAVLYFLINKMAIIVAPAWEFCDEE